MVSEYYNWFIKLSLYAWASGTDTSSLIFKFPKMLQLTIIDKIFTHRFENLVNCYAIVQLVEASIKARYTEHN